ncbi:DMT family transporter [Fulvimarina sp. 2208YS6-2-32]|uniref:DMT family transporter n=1 Tax=Fulvimarina uroteuthidis TaxID=3098149 RepID=A0ABU5I2J3_9HYPH|nr:DMT family transporter [Fulvimarina sp. 2208YS6-2-32]MDY8109592.1 DMT family transporter [Fulvimarina sp. 2208YS6-2-32]
MTNNAIAESNRVGLLLIAIGGMVLSFDIPLIRLSGSDYWSVLFLRSLLISGAAVGYWAFRRYVQGHETRLVDGWKGLFVTLCYAVGVTSFLYSVFNTTAANTVFILAFNSVFAALLSWVLFGERPSRTTMTVIPVTIAGVCLIIGSGLETGNWTGDLAALNAAFFIALALVVSRGSRRDMRYAAALGSILPALVALPIVLAEGFQSQAPVWLVLNGGLVVPIALICLAAGPMFVPAPLVSLGYLLETVFTPVWVWLVFDERPAALAFAGGGVILAALCVQTMAELRSNPKPGLATAASGGRAGQHP